MIADTDRPTIDAHPSRRRRILGVRVDDVTWDEALAEIESWRGADRVHRVVTPNPEIVMRARGDRDLWAAIETADLAPADGVGLRWAGRLVGQPIRAVVPGSDLVPRLAERAGPRGERWFLLGAAPGIAERAGAALTRRFTGLVVAGTHAGSPRPEDDAAALRCIDDARPVDVLLVAYGAPGQETWLARNHERLVVPVTIAVGGTFNFLAGVSRTPPPVVKRTALIWLYRLATEPWRWRRQLALVRFALLVGRAAIGSRLSGIKAARTCR
jgi:N-acetylglucosaminyldiphosphoundecaprenol N-acetyl-beta-D-mannosaminyltransferase